MYKFNSKLGWLLASLYLLSILVNSTFFLILKSFPEISCPPPLSDGDFYINISLLLDRNSIFVEKEPFYYSPLYAFIINEILNITGYKIFSVNILNIIIGSFIPPVLFLIALELFRKKNLILILYTTLILIFLDILIIYNISILKTSVGILLLSLGFLFFLKFNNTKKRWQAILSGLFHSLAILIYANLLLVVIFLCLYIALYYKSIKNLSYFSIPIVIILLFTSIINYSKSNDFILITSIGGIHFYIGNNKFATGIYKPVPGIRANGFGHYFDAKDIAQEILKRKLKPSEVSNFWKNLAFEDIRENPIRYFKLLIKKTLYLFNYFDVPNNINKNYIKEHSRIFDALTLPFWVFLVFGLTGFIISIREKDFFTVHIFFLTYALSVILFFVNDRYRLPLLVPLFIYTVYFFEKLSYTGFKKNVVIYLITLVLSIILVFQNLDIHKLNFNAITQRFNKKGIILCKLREKFLKNKDEKSTLSLALFYIKNKGYEPAEFLIDEILRMNPNNKYAKYLKYKIRRYRNENTKILRKSKPWTLDYR